MATAMHEGTTFQQSIAWKEFHEIIDRGLNKTDPVRVCELTRLCWEEVQESYYHDRPNEQYFGGCVTVGAHWAVKILPKVSSEAFTDARMRLCGYIAEGWLFCKDGEDEGLFANTLRSWSNNEQKRAADIVRQTLEFRFPIPLQDRKNPSDRLLRFLAGTKFNSVETIMPELTELFEETRDERRVVRTVAKALGNYLSIPELVQAARYLKRRQRKMNNN